MYGGILSDARIENVVRSYRETTDSEVPKMSIEQMAIKAREGYFIRDADRNLVICPQGKFLRPKSGKKSGDIRFCNKLACKRCKMKCTTAKSKEADFSKDRLEKPEQNGTVCRRSLGHF